MKLNLKRPLAFFDIEATGTNIGTDRIVEIAVIKLHPDGTEEVKAWRVNPGMPIPYESSVIHGIFDEHIKDEPEFKDMAADLAEFLAESDLAGFNSNKFDVPMLMEEFLRAGIAFDIETRHLVDVQNIFHQMEQRTLKAAYRFYCDKEIINAHNAEADTRATMEVLLAQLARYENMEIEDREGKRFIPVVNDVQALHQFTNLNKTVDFAGRMVYNADGHEVFNFGKHKGKRVFDVFDVEPSYYSWMMQGDFPLYTKQKVDDIYKRWSQEKAARPKPAPQQKPAEPAQQNTTGADNRAANNQFQKSGNNQFQKRPYEQRPYNKPYQQNQHNQQYRKKDEPAKPVDDDMLKALSEKFKKG